MRGSIIPLHFRPLSLLAVFQIIGHLYILKYSLTSIPRPKNKTFIEVNDMTISVEMFDDEENKQVYKDISQCISHHCMIIRTSKEVLTVCYTPTREEWVMGKTPLRVMFPPPQNRYTSKIELTDARQGETRTRNVIETRLRVDKRYFAHAQTSENQIMQTGGESMCLLYRKTIQGSEENKTDTTVPLDDRGRAPGRSLTRSVGKIQISPQTDYSSRMSWTRTFFAIAPNLATISIPVYAVFSRLNAVAITPSLTPAIQFVSYPHSLSSILSNATANRSSYVVTIINLICEPQLASEYYVFGIKPAQTRSRTRSYGGRRESRHQHRKHRPNCYFQSNSEKNLSLCHPLYACTRPDSLEAGCVVRGFPGTAGIDPTSPAHARRMDREGFTFTSADYSALRRFGVFTFAIFGQLCHISIMFEVLGATSERLINAVYAVPWECMDVPNRRAVLMLLRRVQTPIRISALGIADVGVQTMLGLPVKCLLYADYQVILAPLGCEFQRRVTKMNDPVKKERMKLNVSKNKVMVYERSEHMKAFLHMVGSFTNDGKHDGD
ncbi:hypothetical protein EVAR_35684_1 [Eumeta japonica]|uniref:Uncharacterized protein n=1 Tax=Eumeta variegata TaxID=151549 RepID=A0A4C1VEF6_EUMVA|nr:hypothetical protein EVAR_35684_1 [Eumeta japonica]